MGKKSYQSEGDYARQGSQPKKRRPQRPRPQPTTQSAAQQAAPAGTMSTPPTRSTSAPSQRPAVHSTAPLHSYVISDVKRIGLYALVAFVILIILAIVL